MAIVTEYGKQMSCWGCHWILLSNMMSLKVQMLYICAIKEQQLDCLQIKACDIQKPTMLDPLLSQVYSYTLNG